VKPILQALVLAEKTYTDRSGKKIICGTFNGIKMGAATAPHAIERTDGSKKKMFRGGEVDAICPYAYINLTDVVDRTELTLQFTNFNKNQVLFETRLRLKPKNGLKSVEIVAPLPALHQVLKEVGTYVFEVVWNNEVIGSHRLSVTTDE
jgi:hypothetical protein